MKISAVKDRVEQQNTGIEVTILDANGDPYTATDGSPATITILGVQSKAVRKATDRQTDHYIRNASVKTTAEDVRASNLSKAAAGCVDWHGWEDDTGKALPFTPDNIRELLAADEDIFAQVDTAQKKHAAFLARAKPSS